MKTKDDTSDAVSEPVTGTKVVSVPWPKVFLGVTLFATVVGALFSTKSLAYININVAAAKEAARPANVKIVKITDPSCKDCFNVDAAIAGFKKLNIKVKEEKTLVFDSPEASASIKLLAIKKIPTYIVTGEITKKNIADFTKINGEIKDNTFVFTNITPLYRDTATDQKVGNVTATILTDSSCSQCLDPALTVESLKKAGVTIADQKEIVWNSAEGQQIITAYKITKVPTLLLSPDIDYYTNVKAAWPKIGTIEQDKTYVARNLNLPYRDIASNQIVGLVDVIYLTDSSCTDCYKVVDLQKPILTNGYGVALRSERSIDISSPEGQGLISKYGITKVPTIILSPDADGYTNLKNVWPQVGKVGSDGWYVFTDFSKLGEVVYKDVTTNQVIKPTGQPTPAPTK